MKRFKVIAMFEYPEIDRSVLIDAVDAHQALLRAVLDRQLPICYRRNAAGNLQPVYWDKRFAAGNSRWPRVDRNRYLVWPGQSSDNPGRLRFEVIELGK